VRHAAFMVPAGLGVQEAAVVLLAQLFGVDREVALSFALVKRMREVIFGCLALLSWQAAELVRGRRALVREAPAARVTERGDADAGDADAGEAAERAAAQPAAYAHQRPRVDTRRVTYEKTQRAAGNDMGNPAGNVADKHPHEDSQEDSHENPHEKIH
jgi:hypothetical protein